MELNNYLLHALLIAACIPILDVIATWYYALAVRRRNGLAVDAQADRGEVLANAPARATQADAAAPSIASGALPSDLAAGATAGDRPR